MLVFCESDGFLLQTFRIEDELAIVLARFLSNGLQVLVPDQVFVAVVQSQPLVSHL